MSNHNLIPQVEQTWSYFVDAVHANAAIRHNEDARRFEENGIELQGIVMAGGGFSMKISKAMDMVLENQITREHDKADERSNGDITLARVLLDLVVNQLRPYLGPIPAPSQVSFQSPPIKSPATVVRDRPVELNCNQVPVDRHVVQFPQRSNKFYILECPICNRAFDKAGLLYNHIYISHQGILIGEKSYEDALDIGGTLIIDANEEWQKKHNARVLERENVSNLKFRSTKSFYIKALYI
jgi:hypothetical protein